MKKQRYIALMALILATMLVAACGGASTGTPSAPAGNTSGSSSATATTAPAGGASSGATAEATSAITTTGASSTSAAPTAEGTSAAMSTPAAGTGAYGDLKVMQVEPGARIVFSGWGDQTEQQVYRDSIARFKQFYPNVTVDYQPVPSDFQTKMKAAMAGGTAPDVMYIDDQLMSAFGPTGQLLPLDNYLAEAGEKRSDFMPQLLPIFTLNNQTLGLPKDWGTLGLVYLPEAFKDAGIPEPTANWTWNDLKTAADTIAKKGTYKGYCMAPDWARLAPFVLQAGGTFVASDNKTATLNSQPVNQAVSFIAGLKQSGSLVTPSDMGASWCGEAIGKKLVAMTYEGGWMVNFMNQSYKDVNWNAVPLPAGSQGQADIIFTNALGVNAKTKYPKAAAALAIFITSRYNQAEIVKTGFAYSTHPDQFDLIQNPKDKAIATGGTWKTSQVAYWGPNTGAVETVISKALERVYLGDQNVTESLTQAQSDAQKALQGQ